MGSKLDLYESLKLSLMNACREKISFGELTLFHRAYEKKSLSKRGFTDWEPFKLSAYMIALKVKTCNEVGL